MTYKFSLEPYNGMDSRTMCPNCRDRRNTFTRYIDNETQTYLAEHVGKCERIESCGYHFTPREFFKTNPDKRRVANVFPTYKPKPKNMNEYKVLPWYYVEDSLCSYEHNYFMCFLNALVGEQQAMELARKYHIGTASHWYGSTIFWQVDANNRVRTGKIMLYNPEDCRRVKEPFNHITWVHALLSKKSDAGDQKSDLNIKQCLFGEHLLKTDPHKIVAITESEKTAVIASAHHPEYTWLAAGSLEGLTVERCKPLEGRRVILYPDVNGYDKWYDKACGLNARMHTTKFTVSDYLLRTATPYDIERGIDIADLWIDELLAQWEIEKEWGLR